ncbi:MAG: hypothetical protein AAFR97_12345, partial [Bacteroidota bacterium]
DDISTALGLVEDVADMLATLQELQILMQQDPENFPTELQLQLQEAIDCLTNPEIVDKSVCEDLIENVIEGLEELQAELYDADFQVDFLPADEMVYGYDTLSYPEMDIRGWYIQVPAIDDRPYSVAWKSVPQGESDYILARRDPAGSLDSVRFVYQDPEIEVGSPAPVDDDRILRVDFASSPTVFARQFRSTESDQEGLGNLGNESSADAESLIAGQLALVEYPEKELNVVLVPLNGASPAFNLADPALAEELQRIYRPAIVLTNVSVHSTPFQVDGIDVIPDQASGVSSYPQPLRRIINEFGDQNPDLDNNTYYLFVCQNFAGDQAGFMPRKRQFGFLYLNNAPTEPIAFARLMGHELGHGAYHLQHPWEETTLPKNATDNLMDYAGGGRLHKWQWDLIDDPVGVLGIFEGDEGGEAIWDVRFPFACISSNTLEIQDPRFFISPSGRIISLESHQYPVAFVTTLDTNRQSGAVAIIYDFLKSGYYQFSEPDNGNSYYYRMQSNSVIDYMDYIDVSYPLVALPMRLNFEESCEYTLTILEDTIQIGELENCDCEFIQSSLISDSCYQISNYGNQGISTRGYDISQIYLDSISLDIDTISDLRGWQLV